MTGAVLVLRALGLGDALTAVPALRGVRRAWPDRTIIVAGRPDTGSWLHQHQLVDTVVTATGLTVPLDCPPAPDGVGHIAVNLHGRGPQSHRLLLATRPDRLVAFECPATGTPGPAWDSEEHEVDRWCRLITDAGGSCGREDLRLPAPGPRRGHVVVHPGAASESRRWPPERFAAVAGYLVAAGRDVVVTGAAPERAVTAQVAALAPGVHDVGGRLDLPALARLIATADLLISADTGVAHLATAYATRSVVLFGPTPPRLWGPAIDTHLHTTLWHGAGAGPGDPHADRLDPVLAAVTVEEVLEAVLDLLASAPRDRLPAT